MGFVRSVGLPFEVDLRVRLRGVATRTDARSPSHPPVAGPYAERVSGKRAEAADPQNSLAAPALSSGDRPPHAVPPLATVIGIVRPVAESGAGPIGRDVLNLRNGVAVSGGELAATSAASMHT